MRILPKALLVRPRLLIALGAIAIFAVLMPSDWRWTSRMLIAWDAGAVLYLVLLSITMFREGVA